MTAGEGQAHRSAGRGLLTAAVLLVGLYLVLEVVYLLRLPLVMDEFQGAAAVRRLAEGLPYRDFQPYKTVLGYYLQLPLLLLPADPWNGLLAVKLGMAVLTALAILAGALVLTRHFDRRAVLAGTAMLVVMSTLLERSPDLRVDMPTAIAGLASLLLLLERRFAWAGLAAGLSFLISQKGVYYVLAGEAALLACLLTARDRSAVRAAAAFNLAAGAALAVYVGLFGALSSPGRVVETVFSTAGRVATEHIEGIRVRYWARTLRWNPLFWGLGMAALLELGLRLRRGGWSDRLLLPYGATLGLLGVWHRQPWPYFFVLLIPTIWVLVVAFFDRRGLALLGRGGRTGALAWSVFLLLGILSPLGRLPANLSRDNSFQRGMFRLADAILEPGQSYLAGVDVLWHRDQALPELAWLDRGRLTRLWHEPPAARRERAEELAAAPIGLILDNYRIQQLPTQLRRRLYDDFAPFWGNLRLPGYVAGGENAVLGLDTGGDYLVRVRGGGGRLDGRPVADGDRVKLAAGSHRWDGDADLRLIPVPAGAEPLMTAELRKPRAFFPNVYDY